MEKVFKKFHALFTNRCDHYELVNFREDAIRYDFFCTLSDMYSLEPWQIQLERVANPETYMAKITSVPSERENRK